MAFGIGDSLVTSWLETMEAPATRTLLSFLMLPLKLAEPAPLRDLWNKDVLIQKLIYIYNNPLS